MKRFLCLLCLLVLLACCTLPARAADVYIQDMDVLCDIDKNGNGDFTITINVNFDSPSTDVRLPLPEHATRVSVSGGTFTKKIMDGVHWVVLRDNGGVTGTRTFVLNYTVKNVITIVEGGTQQMNVELLTPNWTWRADNLHFRINLPFEFTSRPEYKSGYYGDGIAVRAGVTGTSIEGNVLTAIMDQESVSVILNLPAGYCRIRHLQGTFDGFTTAAMIVIAAICALYWALMLRNPLPGDIEQKQPPNGVGAWEFPYVSNSGSPDGAIMLFEWANLGYLTIHQNKRGRLMLTREMEMGSERRDYENKAFLGIFGRADSCAGDTASLRKTLFTASEESVKYWNSRLFSDNSGNPALLHLATAVILGLAWMRCADYLLPSWALRVLLIIPMLPIGFAAGYFLQIAFQTWLRLEPEHIIPGAAIIVLSFLLANNEGGKLIPLLALLVQLLSAALTYRGGKRSQNGMDITAQIRAFRRELMSSDSRRLQLLQNAEPQYFYRMLPYAEAMGLGRIFARRFENIHIDPCPWLQSEGSTYRNALEFYDVFKDVLHRFRRGGRAKRLLPNRDD